MPRTRRLENVATDLVRSFIVVPVKGRISLTIRPFLLPAFYRCGEQNLMTGKERDRRGEDAQSDARLQSAFSLILAYPLPAGEYPSRKRRGH